MKKNNKAFTLVELIVVITILAILGTIAFINLQGYSTSARDGKRVSDINNIMKKIGIESSKGTSLSSLITTTKTNSGLTIDGISGSSIQGTANFSTLKEDGSKFKDPVTKGDYVLSYSVGGSGTGAYKFNQVSTVNEDLNQSVVKGNYYLMQTGDSPSLIKNNKGNFVTNEGIELPYSLLSISCPTGYVLVLGSSTFSTSDFCVAKYEMKNVGGVATSQSAGIPWVSINQPNAITACNDLGAGFHLITNNEWMTIARDIEENSQNWANGVVGSLVSAGGGLYRGNVNLNDSASCGSNIVLDGETAGTNCLVSGRNKRMHILSNGSEIWDLSGNVWEHVNGTNNISSTTGEVSDGNACNDNVWHSWNNINDGNNICTFTNTTPTFYSRLNYGPLGDYNANYGVGRIYSSTNTNRIFIRGGHLTSTANAGIFTLSLGGDINTTLSTGIGFRCALSIN
ncbi:MAG: type II secretion system protein [Candidatus Gracilibacteria bacterium]|nr:type II secretion system protein [Candidatus Gracilibacteria bacterium]